MGFKEGWQKGKKVAEKIYRVSGGFQDAHDSELNRRLRDEGMTMVLFGIPQTCDDSRIDNKFQHSPNLRIKLQWTSN